MPLAPRPRTETALRDLRSNGGDCWSMAVGEGDLRLRLLCRRGFGGRFLGEEGKERKERGEGEFLEELEFLGALHLLLVFLPFQQGARAV